MRTRVRGWRWRRNPLRRRSDVVEAWTVLLVTVLLCVAAPLVGVFAGVHAHDQARALAAAQRAERHEVRAVVVGDPAERPSAPQGDRRQAYRAQIRWTEPGKGVRTAWAQVPAGARAGEPVSVWFDSRGRSVAPPPSEVAVWQHAVTVGLCAAGGTATAVYLGRLIQRRIALRHRLAEWEREWERTGPRWTQPRM
ncbi:Rv1733c family protein [Streptomyces eurythermus]|uniref:Rv1733c family protein n=1 Tax=Streptomyces eurythermus TaxID=42237 RepID=UPI0036FCB3F2